MSVASPVTPGDLFSAFLQSMVKESLNETMSWHICFDQKLKLVFKYFIRS